MISSQPRTDVDFDPEHERVLQRGVLAGEVGAVAELGRRLGCVEGFLASLNRRRGSPFDSADLADLQQDTHVVVLRKLPVFPGHVPLEAWVHRICSYEFMNALRRKQRDAGVKRSPVEHVPAVESSTDNFALREAILRALSQLDAGDSEIIRLKHFDDLTFEAIGESTGLPANTCKTRYYRALTRLERQLGDLLE